MPSSYHGHISEVLELYLKANPKTVLDVGVGFGKWGVLFREYGDIFRGRLKQTDWKTQIHGVEIFPEYSNCIYKEVYNEVYFIDIKELAPTIKHYDFIYAGDVIEHLEKDDAIQVILRLKKISKQFVLSIPLSDRWPQGEVFGNKYESHLSVWTEEELKRYFNHSSIYKNPAGKPIGLFYDV